jgi:23S rRNA pseudouridine2605 synthase
MKERIQKILANAGVDSRRNVEEMIRQGRIAVNGRVMTELPILINPEKDKVSVDDEPIKLGGKTVAARRVYLLMNKPRGVYSTNVAQGEQTRAIDLLPPDFSERVYPVGRLDAESQGLLLLTNDGELTNQLTHPRYGISKTYKAVVDGYISPATVEELQRGVWLADTRTGKGIRTGKSWIKIVKRLREKSILEITIREGRNRQVRRMLAKLGHKVRELTRVKMGPLDLKGLQPGEVRMLLPREVRELKALATKHLDRSSDDPEKAGETPAAPGRPPMRPGTPTGHRPKPSAYPRKTAHNSRPGRS